MFCVKIPARNKEKKKKSARIFSLERRVCYRTSEAAIGGGGEDPELGTAIFLNYIFDRFVFLPLKKTKKSFRCLLGLKLYPLIVFSDS